MRRATLLGGSFVFSGVLTVDLPGVFADLVWVSQTAGDEVLGPLHCQELGERLVQHMLGDFVFFDEELGEEGLVERASLFIVTAAVQLLRFLQEFEAGIDEGDADAQVFDDPVQAFRELLALASDVPESCSDLIPGECAVCSQIDEVALFDVEALDLLIQLLLEQACGPFAVAEDVVDM